MNFRSFLLPLLALAVLSSSGCAVHMAATQPSSKPTSLFRDGTSKDQLVAYFGPPTSTVVHDGTTYDIYTFENGSNGSTKFLKCLFYGICDVGTLGITEVIFTPIESALRKRDKAYRVSYDSNGDVNSVKVLRW
jgi:outer membrane protein assembly factor BamE (lipoprotein component of BamABCDE complex)